MSTDEDTERVQRVMTLAISNANTPAYFCPLFGEHDRVFAYLTMPQLLAHLLDHTDNELERYINYNHDLLGTLNNDEIDNENTFIEYYNQISIEQLAPLSMYSERAMGVYDYRVSKIDDIKYESRREFSREDIIDKSKLVVYERLEANMKMTKKEILKVIDDHNLTINTDELMNAEEIESYHEALRQEENIEHVQDGLGDIVDQLEEVSEEELETVIDQKDSIDIHLPIDLVPEDKTDA